MNPKYKIVLLWTLVFVFLATFTYGLTTGQFSQGFNLGALFGIAVMSVAKRLEKYRQGLVSEIKERHRKPLAANPADYGLTWGDIVQAANRNKQNRIRWIDD